MNDHGVMDYNIGEENNKDKEASSDLSGRKVRLKKSLQMG